MNDGLADPSDSTAMRLRVWFRTSERAGRLSALLLFALAAAPAAAQDSEFIDGLLDRLYHNESGVRESSCVQLRYSKTQDPTVIRTLMKVYGNSGEVPAVQRAALEALKALTGKNFESKRAWDNWWEEEGSKRFVETDTYFRQLKTVEDELRQMEKNFTDLQRSVDEARLLFQVIFTATVLLAVLIVAVVIAFSVMGGSRLKAMRETVRQAERYITAGEEVHKRFDGIVNELEAKKTDILDFFRKLKEEHQAEIERYAELLEQNTEHRMREEAMGLRQKGEKELGETLLQLKSAVRDELQRQAAEQKAAVAAEVQAQEKRFLDEVEAHTRFLEGSMAAGAGRNEDAVRIYRRVLALKPQHLPAWTHLAAALRKLNRLDEAHESLRRAGEIAPAGPQVHYETAAAWAAQRRREPMLAALEKAIQADGELRDDALNDPAFRDYWLDPAFKDLAEA